MILVDPFPLYDRRPHSQVLKKSDDPDHDARDRNDPKILRDQQSRQDNRYNELDRLGAYTRSCAPERTADDLLF